MQGRRKQTNILKEEIGETNVFVIGMGDLNEHVGNNNEWTGKVMRKIRTIN